MNTNISYSNASRIILFHLSVVLVFISGYSFTALITFLILYLARLFVITGFYHRYYSHQSYQTSRWLQFILTLIGTSAGQQGPLSWATSHITHHQHADTRGDPHSPVLTSGLYAHIGWLMQKDALPTNDKLVKPFLKFPEIVFLDRYHYLGTTGLIISLALLGTFLSTHHPELGTSALQLVSWGFILSTLLILHGACLVNSVAHLYGYRRFRTTDNSHNVWWLFPLTLGDNWHNNHHHTPRSASFSYAWWEVDIIYLCILLLEKSGLVWNVKRPQHQNKKWTNTEE